MSQSLSKIYLHLVFSTKHRHPFLQEKDLQQETHAYLTALCLDYGSPSIVVGGVADHVHLLCYLSRTVTVADLVRDLKKQSSKWVKRKGGALGDFHWQNGYGAFSLSPVHVNAVRRYIAEQEAHHRREDFQEEYRRLLRKYGVEFDERYVWD